MSYRRGAHNRGNTEVPIVSVPRITGSVRRDTSGNIASLPLPSTLKVETDAGSVSVTFSTRALNSIVTALNVALAGVATAEDRHGCLSLASVNAGAGAYVRIKAPTSGFPDAAPFFGYRVDPHPLATVSAGDVERAEVRPMTEANPEGTAFIAHAADRAPRSFNRGLLRLSQNLDYLYTLLTNPVARPVVLEVDPTDVGWAARLTLDADDNVEQIDLSDLYGISPALDGRVWVGDLDGNSTINEISAYFRVLDADDNEIVAADSRVVRVVAATRGTRIGLPPSFADDWSAPGAAISDTASPTPDGGNALGVDLVRSASSAITEVLDHATIVAAGATYVTDGVIPGDIALISGSGIDTPTNHNGEYIVEVVVSEEQLVLRPRHPQAHGDLNLSGGVLGDIEVSSGGQFQNEVWLSFDPPIPPQQVRGGVGLKVVVGLESSVGTLHADAAQLLVPAVRGAAEVDGFGMRDIWGQLNFGGVYDGHAPRTTRGAGGYGSFTRPASMLATGTDLATTGTSVRTVTGGSTDGIYLTAGAGDEFTAEDVGRVFLLTVSTRPGLPCLAVRLDGNQRIALVRLDDEEGSPLPTDATVAYDVRDDAMVEFPSMMQARSNTSSSATRGGGFVALHEVTDIGSTSHKDLGWYGLASLERVVLSDAHANILGITATLGALGSDTLVMSFDPTEEPAILAPENDALTAGTFSPHASLIRIFDGPDAGWYKAQELRSGTSTIVLVNLDGSAVTFTVGAYASRVGIYNLAFATNVPVGDGQWAAGRFFANWHQVDPAELQDGVLSVGWRGGDEDSAGIKIQPNDIEDGVGVGKAQGWGVYLVVSTPMTGGYRGEAFDGGVAIALASTPGATAYPDYTDMLGQGVGFMGSAAGHVGRGPGLYLLTSLWMGRSTSPGATTWDDGAFLTEATAGLGRAAYPVDATATESYLGSGGFTGWNAPTRLGHPAVLYPSAAGGTTTAAIEQPDLAQFAMAHSGILTISGLTDHPPTSLLGCRVLFLNTTSVGQFHRIIAVSGTKAALEGAVDVVGDDPSASIVVYGARWREFHGDVADFMQVGTRWRRSQKDAPLLTIGHSTTDAAAVEPVRDNSHYFVDFDAPASPWAGTAALTGAVASFSGTTVTGNGATLFLSEVTAGQYFKISAANASAWTRVRSVTSNNVLVLETAYPHQATSGAAVVADASAVGVQADQAALLRTAALPLGAAFNGVGHRNTTPTDVLAGDVLAWANEWQVSYEEPRAPIPNLASLIGLGSAIGTGSLSTAGYRGSLAVDGLAISLESPSGVGAVLTAVSSVLMGGSIRFEAATANAAALALFGGLHGLSRSFHNIEVRVLAAVPVGGNVTVGARLMRSTGEALATSTPVAVVAGTAPQQLVFTFQNTDLLENQPDVLRQEEVDAAGLAVVLSLDFDLVAATDVLLIGKIEAVDKTPPLRQFGPQEVVGIHRAADYRYLTPQKEYIIVGPSQASLLDGDEYGLTEIQETTDASDRRFVEGRGVGMVSIGGSFYRPTYPVSAFFKKGISGATIVGTHPYFDPYWYLVASNLVPSAGNYDTARNLIVMPGRTGFMLPLTELKHGAVLTDIAFTLSLLPCYDSDTATKNFQIWRGWDGLSGPAGATDAGVLPIEDGDKTAWDANEGYVVRVWRRHVLEFGEALPHPQVPPSRANTLANLEFPESSGGGTYVDAPNSGWAEIIWQGAFDLSAVVEPASNDYSRNLRISSTPATLDAHFPTEHFERRTINLHYDNDVEGPATDQLEADRVSKLRVDKRHFEYFVTIEFYVGCREVSTGAYVYDGASEWVDGVISSAGGLDFRGVAQPLRGRASTSTPGNYLPDDGPLATKPSPPRVRFRGLRAGTLTDKP